MADLLLEAEGKWGGGLADAEKQLLVMRNEENKTVYMHHGACSVIPNLVHCFQYWVLFKCHCLYILVLFCLRQENSASLKQELIFGKIITFHLLSLETAWKSMIIPYPHSLSITKGRSHRDKGIRASVTCGQRKHYCCKNYGTGD